MEHGEAHQKLSSGGEVVLKDRRLEFGTGMESTTRQTFLRARIGSAARGAEIGYGAAALPNYGEESSHVQREREKGKRARRVPHHHVKLQRRADVEVWWHSGRITVSQRRVDEASPRENLVRSGAGVGEEELGEDPGPEAKRRRWPAVAEGLRNGRTMAVQG